MDDVHVGDRIHDDALFFAFWYQQPGGVDGMVNFVIKVIRPGAV
jgi:hypothetical protein